MAAWFGCDDFWACPRARLDLQPICAEDSCTRWTGKTEGAVPLTTSDRIRWHARGGSGSLVAVSVTSRCLRFTARDRKEQQSEEHYGMEATARQQAANIDSTRISNR
jgi:hypothetical protein